MSSKRNVQRVKSGCLTCRMRRVKCDEGKPQCNRFMRTGRRCEGYSTIPFSRRDLQMASSSHQSDSPATQPPQPGLVPRLITDPAFSDVLDKRYLQHFCQHTVPSTNSVLNSPFWSRIILQTCHVEPAIRHCVLALSSHHQYAALAGVDMETSQQHERYAGTQYRKALEAGRELIASASIHNIDRVLTTCIIFIVYEGARGNFAAAAMHMDSGRAIVAQNTQFFKNSSRRKDLWEIERTLARLDLPSICFRDMSAPYRYTLADFHRTNPAIVPERFQDAVAAQSCFVDLVRWLLLVGDCLDFELKHGDLESMARYRLEKDKCADAIDVWYTHFEEVAATSDSTTRLAILNLSLWYCTAKLYICAEEYGREDRWDAFSELYQQMIGYGEELARSLAEPRTGQSCSFDLGYMIPLFVVATKCRDPKLRRQAIAVLRDYPRQEGPWKSAGAAAIATRWMEVEEEGLAGVSSERDIPEGKRVVSIDTRVDVSSNSASIMVTTSGGERPMEVVAQWQQIEA